MIESRNLLVDSYKHILDEKLFYQNSLTLLYQELKIEDKLVIREILDSQERQYKILKTKIEPVFETIKEKLSRISKDDLPIMATEEQRLKEFIKEVQIEEMDLKQYFNDSNMIDYIKILPISFSIIVDALRELRSFIGVESSTDSKNATQLKRILDKIDFSPKKDKRQNSKNMNATKKSKKSGAPTIVRSSFNVSQDETNKIQARAAKVVTPDISADFERLNAKSRSGKNKGSVQGKESTVIKSKQLKNIKSTVSRLIDEPKIQYLFLQSQEMLSSDYDSSESEEVNKVDTLITRKKIRIKKQVKNQMTQTDNKNAGAKRIHKRGSLSSNASPNAKKSLRGKYESANKTKQNLTGYLDTPSQADYSDIGSEDLSFLADEKVFLNKELVSMIKEVLSGKVRKKTIHAVYSKGSMQNKPSSYKKSKSKESKSPRREPEQVALSPLKTKYEMVAYPVQEVRSIIGKLYEKLLVCLDNDEMKAKFNKSFKEKPEPVQLSRSTSLTRNSGDVFMMKIDLYRAFKERVNKVFMRADQLPQMHRSLIVYLKDIVEKECSVYGKDPYKYINSIFKDVMVEDKIDTTEIKKKKKQSQANRPLKHITEVDSSVSDFERAISEGVSLGTIYTGDERSQGESSPNRKDSPFHNEVILRKSGYPPKEFKLVTHDVEVQCGPLTKDK